MDTLWHDIRYGLRTLTRSPGFAIVAILTLALGIGANTAIFSVVDAVLLRPLPYRSPNQLVQLWTTESSPGSFPLTGADFLDWRAQNHSFEDMAVYTYQENFNASGAGDPERVTGVEVQSNFFGLLGVRPIFGRDFLAGEDVAGKNHVALLSYGFWQRHFAGDRGALGRSVQLNSESYEIVGVMPAWYKLPGGADLWIPIDATLKGLGPRGEHHLRAMGRIKDGLTLAQANADMKILTDGLAKQYPDNDADAHAILIPLRDQIAGSSRSELWTMFGAVTLVLLIACVNVANLTLARATNRQREIAVRAALGAGRGRLIRQLLTESVMLSIAGAIPGIGLAFAFVVWLRNSTSAAIIQPNPIGIEPMVLLFTLGVSVVVGILFGLMPALQISRTVIYEELKAAGKMAVTATNRGRLVRDALVAVEIALSLALLIGAGLLIRTFSNLRRVDIGVQQDKVLTAAVLLLQSRYATLDQQQQFFDRLLQSLSSAPGVQGAAVATELPLLGGSNGYVRIPALGDTSMGHELVEWDYVTPQYFSVMGIPVIEGSVFTDAHMAAAADVVRKAQANASSGPNTPPINAEFPGIINQTMAKKYWPNKSAIGQIFFGGGSIPVRVIGVVGDTKPFDLRGRPMAQAYFPFPRALGGRLFGMYIAVRGAGKPEALAGDMRDSVKHLDGGLAVYGVSTIPEIISFATSGTDYETFLLGLFAALALVLASIGIYGVLSCVVTQRTSEIGIRMALGADRGNVLWMVLRQGMVVTALGIALGIAAASALTTLLASVLYGVKPSDPVTFVAVSVFMALVAMTACLIPALRATRVDPVIALRYE
jgi:putative ABC transport system permease protein